jgi:hypothetical protein
MKFMPVPGGCPWRQTADRRRGGRGRTGRRPVARVIDNAKVNSEGSVQWVTVGSPWRTAYSTSYLSEPESIWLTTFDGNSSLRLLIASGVLCASLELMEVAGPWRVEAGLGPMTSQERRELFDRMTGWYFDSGNGMLLAATTRELYLNAKFNLICGDGELRPRTLVNYIQGSVQEREQKRGRLSMSQLSLLRAQMRNDLAIYGGLYQTGTLSAEDEIFLKEAGADLRKPPWKSRKLEERTSQRGFSGTPR